MRRLLVVMVLLLGCSVDANRDPSHSSEHAPDAATVEAPALPLEVLEKGKACEAGDATACVKLGAFYRDGEMVPKDERRAVALFERGCNAHVPRGCGALGWMYDNGKGVPPNQERARELLTASCSAGDGAACRHLANIYDRDRPPLDRPRAVTLFEKSCEAGDLTGCWAFGWYLFNGQGRKKDLRRAAEIFERACQGRIEESCRIAGQMYDVGQGVTRDTFRAAKNYERGCDGKDGVACNHLGALYAKGRLGQPDLDRAEALFAKGCVLGEKTACQNVESVRESILWASAFDASDLWDLYDANEVAADGYWKGQRRSFVGRLQSIDKDFAGEVILALRSRNRFLPARAYLEAGDAEEQKAARLQKGGIVLMTCTVRGRILGSPVLEHCVVAAQR